jgi:hypothetical protein
MNSQNRIWDTQALIRVANTVLRIQFRVSALLLCLFVHGPKNLRSFRDLGAKKVGM